MLSATTRLGLKPSLGILLLLSATLTAAPLKGQTLYTLQSLGELNCFSPPNAPATFKSVAVDNPPFDWALEVALPAATPNPWDVQILTPSPKHPIKRGDQILISFYTRMISSDTGALLFNARLQANSAPWTGIASNEVTAGKEWKQIFIHGEAPQDFAPHSYNLALHLGIQGQTLQIADISILNLGTHIDPTTLPFTPITYPGSEPDAPWRKLAAERIEKHRKANLTIKVVDNQGNPIKDAEIRVEMQRHAFGFGTYLENEVMVAEGTDADNLRAWTLKLFNRCTSPVYWADWGWVNPEVRQRYLGCAKWAQQHNLPTRGHCIIYPGWQFMPAEARKLADNPAALRQRLLDQILEVSQATREFNFAEYDVCNELRDLQEIHTTLGREAVVEWFKTARAQVPNSKMAINENTILTRAGITTPQQDNYAEWIQYLIDQGQPPGVIGMQGHFYEAVTNPELVISILDRFAKFNIPIHITEYDLITRDEQGQALYTRDFLTAIFSHPSVTAFTVWGFWEGKMWQPPGAMIRRNWELKPNGYAWLDLIKREWWTNATLLTATDGTATLRAFHGDYQLTITANNTTTTRNLTLTTPTTTTIPLP